LQIFLLYWAFFYLFNLFIELSVDFIYKSFFFIYMHYVQWILFEWMYRCNGISNLLTSPYCHTACTLLSVSIVDRLIFGLSRRSISMRIIDCHTNSITWLRSRPCKFSWAASATGYANSLEKRNYGYVRLLNSTRNSLRFMNYNCSGYILLFYSHTNHSFLVSLF